MVANDPVQLISYCCLIISLNLIKIMNKKILIALAFLPSLSYGSVTLSGTSLQGTPGINFGETYVYLADLDGSAFSTGDLASITAGESITDSGTYAGFTVLGSGTVDTFFSTDFVGSGLTFDLNAGVDVGDSFGILVFSNSDTTAIASDTYNIFTDASWVLPADGNTVTFNSDLAQIGSGGSATGVGSVVPEPSTFAALAGLCALGAVMVRRRRA